MLDVLLLWVRPWEQYWADRLFEVLIVVTITSFNLVIKREILFLSPFYR